MTLIVSRTNFLTFLVISCFFVSCHKNTMISFLLLSSRYNLEQFVVVIVIVAVVVVVVVVVVFAAAAVVGLLLLLFGIYISNPQRNNLNYREL